MPEIMSSSQGQSLNAFKQPISIEASLSQIKREMFQQSQSKLSSWDQQSVKMVVKPNINLEEQKQEILVEHDES
jgi:hypothetical protein